MSKMKVYKEGLKYVLKFWPYVLLSISLTSIVTLLTTYSPTLIAYVLDIISNVEVSYSSIIDKVINLFDATDKFEVITVIIIFYGLISVVIFVFRYITSIIFNLTGLKIEKKVREEAIAKLNDLPIDYFSLEPDGKIVAKITSDSNGVRLMFNVSFNIIQAVINIGVVYFALIMMEPMLAVYMLIVVPILLLWITVYRKRIHSASEKIRELSSRITGKLAELISGTSIIQAYNQEENMMNEYKELVFSHNDSDRKVNTVSIFFGWELIQIIKRLVQVGIIAYFGFLVVGESSVVVTGAIIYVFMDYIDKMVQPINTIFDNLNAFEDSIIGTERIISFINEPDDEPVIKGDFPLIEKGNILFKDVCFEYVKDTPILNKLNLDIKHGETVGIVGHTGSGKSTLMNLLLRFNDYQSGQIIVDGYEINQYNKKTYRNHLGIVLQSPAIFKGTLKTNITLEREYYTDQEVIDVLNLVGADFIIKKHPLGIEQPIGFKGENLSLGEKQLIAFARILLRNPKILVLDEATANIDTETEVKIKNAMNVVTDNRTTFIIAHRLSTIADADKIVVLDGGVVHGLGTHKELLETCEKYQEMYNGQFE